MEPQKSFKSYGKIDQEAEERAFRLKTRRRIIIITLSTILLTAAIIGAVAGTLIHKTNDDNRRPPDSNNSAPQSRAEAIQAVCGVTEYPSSCSSSLSASSIQTSDDPEQLFKLSMQIATDEISRISALPDQLASTTDDPRVRAALAICKDLFEDSVEQLTSSISLMEAAPGESLLTTAKINDLKTWLSTVLTNLETCLDGLEETGQQKNLFMTKMKAAMTNSTEFTSNSLAIVAKIITLLKDLDIPIHRKLLGVVHYDFPEWVRHGDRKLLQDTTVVRPDITVAKDGSGDYKTIREAIAAIGQRNKTRTVIYVKQGKYVENVVVDKVHWNVMMYGDGSSKTIVSGSLNAADGEPTFTTASLIAAGRGFIAQDMGFENTAGPEKHQAVAMRSGSDLSVFYRCSFSAYQDTLYAHSNRQFYRDCEIIGTVDFIFGNAAAVLQNCNIRPRQPLPNQFIAITAQGKKDPNQNTGISIHRSTITPLGNVTARTYLGRPWKPYSTTIFMGTEIPAMVSPLGWMEWETNVIPPSSIFYAEFQNTGPGSNVDKRVTWPGYRSSVPKSKAAEFTVGPFIQGTLWLPETSVMFDTSL